MAIELEGLEFKVEGLSGASTKGLEDLTKALNGLKSALPSKNKISTVVSGLSQISTAFAAMQGQTKSLSRFAAAMTELRKARVNPTLGKNLGSLAKNAQRFAKVSDDAVTKIERLANALRDLKGVGKISLSVPKSAMENGDANGEAQNLGETFVEQTIKARNFFSSIMNGSFHATDALKLVKNGAIKVGTALVGIPKFFTGQFASGITTAVKKVGELFAGLKRIAMYRLMRTAIKLFTQGLSEGLKNVYAYSQLVGTSFASNMDLIATNALYAKNSLGAMAAPLLNAIAPAVDYVTDKFVELFNVVNMFIARLTGAETATIAKKAATTWGDATEDAAGRGRQAVEELKRTILGFDELNVLQDNKDKGGGSGSGSGGGADVSSMFEQVPIESSISEFADRLREAFEEGDWSRLGTLLGEKFNDIVNDVPWASIGANIGTGISAAINVVYSGLTAADFVNLGSKFAELFNNALTNFDAETFGKLAVKRFSILADLIIGAITDVNWGLVASKASDYIIGIFKELSTWLQSVNWVALTSSLFDNLVDAVKNVKYAEIASSIAEFFGSAVGAVASVGATIISKIWDGVKNAVLSFGTWVKTDVIDPFVKAFSEGDTAALLELGKNLIEGIFNGIINFFGGIGTWIITNIWNPFVNGFKNAFGIHSPASDPTIVGLGTNLIEGLFNGIINFFGGIVTWITNNVKKPFTEGWNKVFGADGVISNVISVGVGLVKEGWSTLKEFVTAGVDLAKALVSPLIGLAKDGWTSFTNFVTGGINLAKTFASPLIGLAKSGWESFISFVTDGVNLAKQVGSALIGLAKDGWTSFTNFVTGGINLAKTFVSPLIGLAKEGWDTLVDFVTGGIDLAKTFAKPLIELGKQGWDTFTGFVTGGFNLAKTFAKPLIELGKQGWDSLTAFVTGGANLAQTFAKPLIELGKSGWTTFTNFVTGGFNLAQTFAKPLIGLDKDKWTDLKSYITGGANLATTFLSPLIGLAQSGWSTLKSWILGADATKGYVEVPIKMRDATDVQGETNAINTLYRLLDKEKKGENVKAEIEALVANAKDQNWVDFLSVWKEETGQKSMSLKILVDGVKNLTKAKSAWVAFKSKENKKSAKLTTSAKIDPQYTTAGKLWNNLEKSSNSKSVTLKGEGKPDDDYTDIRKDMGRVNWSNTATLKAEGKKKGNAFERIADAMRYASSGNWGAVVTMMAQVPSEARGGAFFGGGWHNIPQYASGGIPSHGTMFVAGEAGAEAVANINGRTEVLNASQLASAIHAAVLSAMQQANGSQSPMLNVTVRTEDNEVLARAVAKGQRSLDARLNPTAAY